VAASKKPPRFRAPAGGEQPPAPEVKLRYSPAGRETLSAIEEELAPKSAVEEAPLIEVSEATVESRTLSTTRGEPAPPRPARQAGPSAQGAADELEIFELLTFIVRGSQASELTTDALRLRFVEQHLLHRVPSRSMASVERVEVTPWTTHGTLVVRVWCKSPANG